MSWLHAIAYVVLAAVLATVYVATAPPPPLPSTAARPAPAAPQLTELLIESDAQRVSAARVDDRWQVREPAGAAIPSDLLAALVTAVLETPAEPVASDGERVAEFGLDAPRTRITFTRHNAPPAILTVGSRNPSGTGVYGRLEGNPQIVLLGLNVQYYLDLVRRAALATPAADG